jgi:tetratricopeptide (TPR) repeat protein
VPGTCVEDFAGEKQATAWLSAERRVLVRVISYAAEAGADVHAWQLPWALADFLDRGGHWSDVAAGQEIALAAAQRLGDRAAQAHAHRYIGRASFQLQDLDHALDHLSSALELRHQLAEPAGEAAVSLDLSHVHEQRGDFDQALRYGQVALRLYRSHANRVGEAYALNSVGWCHALKESYPEALICCEQALELCAQLGRQIHQIARAYVHDSLGFIYRHLGRAAESAASYQRALGIFRRLNNRYFTAMTLTHLGDAYYAADDVKSAREALHEALIIYDDLHHPDRETVLQKLALFTTPVSATALAPRRQP